MESIDNLRLGGRYLHYNTSHPLTLRYIGPLPPAQTNDPTDASSSSVTIWLGVEYDEAQYGKGHSGVYKGIEVFGCRQPLSGAFIKYSPGVLIRGPSFVQAIEERYGSISTHRDGAHVQSQAPTEAGAAGAESETVQLGNSGIVVEAPGMKGVQKRIGRLERLREIGLDNDHVGSLSTDGEEAKVMVLRERLKGVRILNLSNSTLETWQVVASIVDCLENVTTLVLNNTRTAALPPDVQDQVIFSLGTAFTGVDELHLGQSLLQWEEVRCTTRFFPNLKRLHLNDNQIASVRDGLSNELLQHISLSGNCIDDWHQLVKGLGGLPGLASIDLSDNPFSTIPSPSGISPGTFLSLTTLILLSSRISSWSDIDALQKWTAGRLSALRFSLYEGATMKPVSETLSGVDLESKEASIDRSRDQAEALADSNDKDSHTATERISGYARNDRLMFIAILSSLTMLNSTPVSASERRDAEMWYVNHLGQGASPSDIRIGRYDELRLKYGLEAPVVEPLRPQGLRSKMLTLKVHGLGTPFDMAILRSAPISLLRKKIAKRLNEGVVLYTVRETDGAMSKVAQVDDGQQVDWWYSPGDAVWADRE